MASKKDLVVKQQGVLSSNPSAPPAGYAVLFPKSDGKWYVINSSGTVVEITNLTYNNPLMEQIFS